MYRLMFQQHFIMKSILFYNLFVWKSVKFAKIFVWKNVKIFNCFFLYDIITLRRKDIMKRKIYDDLLAWKNSDRRKPLLLQGARQVGKTYITSIFGEKEYANIIYCDFEREPILQGFFSDLIPDNIIKKISNYKKKEIIPEHTLIIFDEIQACPQALTSLKYFCQEANQYHIIATGSLLGVSLNRQTYSFPVGKVQFMNLYPMDFEEFLMATDNQYLIDEIKTCYKENKPLDKPFHEMALALYKEYLYVGGMPCAIEEYLKSRNYELVRTAQLTIIDSYFNDMSKYNKSSEIPKTKLIYQNINVQLAKENKKFKYNLLKKGGRAKEFEESIKWLCLSGIASQLYRIEQIKIPLNAYLSLSDFKFYMNDVGLCSSSHRLLINDIIYDNSEYLDFKGGLTENYVYNQLIINGLDCYYWTSGNEAELDFITRIGEDIIPIEVKSSDNNKAKSLKVYMDKFKPTYAIRISMKNFGFENNIKSVPLYAVFCIKNKKT